MQYVCLEFELIYKAKQQITFLHRFVYYFSIFNQPELPHKYTIEDYFSRWFSSLSIRIIKLNVLKELLLGWITY